MQSGLEGWRIKVAWAIAIANLTCGICKMAEDHIMVLCGIYKVIAIVIGSTIASVKFNHWKMTVAI